MCHASPLACGGSDKELVEDASATPIAIMPPPIECNRPSKELVEDDGVTPLAGGQVVLCLRLLDMRDPTTSL